MKLFTCLLLFIYVLTENIGQRLGLDRNLANDCLLVFAVLLIMLMGRVGKLMHPPYLYVTAGFVATLLMRYHQGIMSNSFQPLLNLLLPVLVLVVVMQIRARKERMQKVLVNLFIVNSCIAIIEFITKTHVIGWVENTYTGGYVQFDDAQFRSVALWGGPLANAELTCCINGFLLYSSIKKKYYLFFLGTLAIMAYNARTSFYINAAVFALYSITNFHNFKAKQKRLLAGLLVAVAVTVPFILLHTNMGSRLLLGADDDSGSIDVRLQLFDYAMSMNYKDFLFGMSAKGLTDLHSVIGVKVIENFWLLYIFHYGIIVTAYFVTAYCFVFRSTFKAYKLTTALTLILGTIIILSSTNGLYSSYNGLLMLLLCGYVFAPQKNMMNVNYSKYSRRNETLLGQPVNVLIRGDGFS